MSFDQEFSELFTSEIISTLIKYEAHKEQLIAKELTQQNYEPEQFSEKEKQ